MAKPIKVEQHGGLGVLWFIGWLFSIGFLKLGFWKGLLALLIWPYFLGAHIADQMSTPAPVETVEPETAQ
ncbi:MAG: hypothetical protein AAFW68_06860 [Pseudomonadota bacterium]